MDFHDPGRTRQAPNRPYGHSPHRRPRTIQIVANPADDAAFRSSAERLVAAGVTTTDALARALRSTYPRVVVRARDLANEEFDAWYVYRDGTWTRSGGSEGNG
jgi:hypothetical protein